MSVSEATIPIAGQVIDTSLFQPDGETKGSVLFLHGAGESTKDRFALLAQALTTRGYRCLTFSLPGHGESSGTLLGSTLSEREEISYQVAQHFSFWPADIGIAVSMGAHTAMSLLKRNTVAFKQLVLFVPATYSSQAENVPFGSEFTTILRTPGSYRQSQAIHELQSFNGDVLVVQAGRDEVIPGEIYDMIKQQATHTRTFHHVIVHDSTHQLTTWLSEKNYRIAAMADAIDRFEFSMLHQLN